MNKDETLKLALEALVSSTGELHRHLLSPNDYQLVKNHRAITAIKAALEAKDEPVNDELRRLHDLLGKANALKKVTQSIRLRRTFICFLPSPNRMCCCIRYWFPSQE